MNSELQMLLQWSSRHSYNLMRPECCRCATSWSLPSLSALLLSPSFILSAQNHFKMHPYRDEADPSLYFSAWNHQCVPCWAALDSSSKASKWPRGQWYKEQEIQPRVKLNPNYFSKKMRAHFKSSQGETCPRLNKLLLSRSSEGPLLYFILPSGSTMALT